MSWYRETYLKSQEWKSIRLASINKHRFRCSLCGKQTESLDVHHLTYKNLFFEKLSELRPLCRECHEKVHSLFEKFPKLKKCPPRKQWKIVQTHLHKNKEAFKTRISNKGKNRRLGSRMIEFGICRNILSQIGMIKKSKMKWTDSLASGFLNRRNPILFLHEYIRITKIDPRIPSHIISPNRLLTWKHVD